ncbi:MAG: DUF3716 domain-containing protein [Dehalococcoidales bacterium]|nr:DUF3716 domain-containing protein [Dehalococcoidales bacterium]
MKASFEKEINQFIDHVDSLRTTLPLMMNSLSSSMETAAENIQKFIETNNIFTEEKEADENDEVVLKFSIKHDHLKEFKKFGSEMNNAKLANSFIPRSLFVALVSQYDAYLGRLIRVLFSIKPHLITSSERQMNFAQLSKFENMDQAKEFIMEKEIESVLRDSHFEQFNWLEKKLEIPLRRELDIWPDFIELTERRNLFVHTDGKVSSQYCSICRDHGVTFQNCIKVGDTLSVDPKYFSKCCDCIFEIGVKLGHVLWRKLDPDDLQNADKNLNSICYDLIDREQYHQALTMLSFATETLKKHSSEEMELYFLLNKAQTLKWIGSQDDCNKILDSLDWTVKGYKYRLARAVLKDDFPEAVRIMKLIGTTGEIDAPSYKHWPIFKEFRKTEDFDNAFIGIFGHDYLVENKEIKIPKKGGSG